MEAMLSERKRKKSPNPLSGILTRKKSQIYSHLSRSGRVHSDASVLPPHLHQIDASHAPRSRRRLSSSIIAGKDEAEVSLSPIGAKDLRSRRVFSKPPVVVVQEEKNPAITASELNPNLEFAESGSLEKKSISSSDRLDGFGDELSSPVSAVDGEKLDFGFNCIQGEDQIGNSTSCRFSDDEIKTVGQVGGKLGFMEVDSACNEKRLDDCSLDLSNRDQIIDEEIVQTTPPDPDVISMQGNVENRLNELRDVLQPEHRSIGPNQKADYVSRRKTVLNPCARLKVFKTPSSVSYRRLLPYLLDIAKDKSCGKETNICPKIDTILEEKPTVESHVPLSDDNHFIMSSFTDKTLKPMLHTVPEEMAGGGITEKRPSNMQAQITSNPTSTDSPSEDMQKTVVTADKLNEIPASANSYRGDSSHANQASAAKQLKLFQSPSSATYRRLLPYLLDIAKDKSCALEIMRCPKVEVVLEGKPSGQPLAPLSNPSSINKFDLEDKQSKTVLHSASQGLIKDVSEEKFPSDKQASDSTDQMPLNSTTDCPENTLPTVFPTGRQNVMPSPSNPPQGADQSSSMSGEINSSQTLVSDSPDTFTYSTSKCLSGYNGGDHSTHMVTYDGPITAYESTSPLKDLPSTELATVSPGKGILKRNPRGCRGLCTCLNCASFRLHAERAFEFSRNQLQDTEELVLELMKELSQVRTALETSFDVSNNPPIFEANQVKEVCASASKAERIAKTRLKEMNEDLFVHCRVKSLQRPRVNFAKIEEKGSERE